jgi:hypothetical protein
MTTAYSFNPFVAIARLIRAVGEQGRPAYADRIAAYALDEAYYHNQAYGPLTEGGYRQNINAALGNAAAADLSGLYNPVAEVVELYQHVPALGRPRHRGSADRHPRRAGAGGPA